MEQREAPASAIISAMTVGITGPRRRAPWRGAVMVLIIAGIVLSICLILLGLTGDFLVDWLWFSTIGYLGVFWTTIAAEAEVFSAVTLDVSSRRLRMEAHGHCGGARRARIHAPSVAVAVRHRRRCQPPRSACRLGRGPQLGHLPAVPLSCALWCK